MKMNFGKYAFMIGFFGAILVGLLGGFGLFDVSSAIITTILIIAGLAIGYLNADAKEQVPLMIAALVIGAGSAALVALEYVGEFIGAILAALSLVAIPMAVVIAIMVFYQKAK